jgi:hypothetical protein
MIVVSKVAAQPRFDAEPVFRGRADDREGRPPVDEVEVALGRALPLDAGEDRCEDRDQDEEHENPEADHRDLVVTQPLQGDARRRLARRDGDATLGRRYRSYRWLRQRFGTCDDRFHVRYLLPWAH